MFNWNLKEDDVIAFISANELTNVWFYGLGSQRIFASRDPNLFL